MSETIRISEVDDARHATAAPRVVEVPWRKFLAIEGRGRPGGEEFQAAVKALYACAHGVRFALRRQGLDGGRVGSLEGFFPFSGAEEGEPDEQATEHLRWTLVLPADDAVTADLLEDVRAHAVRSAPSEALDHVRLVEYCERTAVEMLYVGPYEGERESIRQLHGFANGQGYQLRGRHHEIYLSDPRRTPPERLRTVLRQPVA
jgi:hypothetical protein